MENPVQPINPPELQQQPDQLDLLIVGVAHELQRGDEKRRRHLLEAMLSIWLTRVETPEEEDLVIRMLEHFPA